jgi:chromosome partitioning protein
MTRTIAIASAKGGIGKTTTAVNLALRLAHYERRILLIDLDTQGQAADALGVTPSHGLYDYMSGDVDATEALLEVRPNVFLLAGGTSLARLDRELGREDYRAEEKIKNGIAPLHAYFDYVLYDFPPAWSLLTINGLFACQEILAPVGLEMLSVQGLLKFLERIRPILQLTNGRLAYVLPTMLDKRLAQSAEILTQLHQELGAVVCEPIRIDVRLSEAPGHGESIFEYMPGGRGAVDYDKLTKRILNDE